MPRDFTNLFVTFLSHPARDIPSILSGNLIAKFSMVKRKIVIVVTLFFFFSKSSFGQCLPRNIFYKKISDSSLAKMPPAARSDSLLILEKQLVQCHYDNDSLQTILLRKIGWACFELKDFSAAIRYFRQSAAIVSAHINSPGIVRSDLVSAWYYLSTFCDSLGKGQETMQYIDSCITTAFRLNMQDELFFIIALYRRLTYFYNIGEYRLCSDDAVLCEKYAGEYIKLASAPYERTRGLYYQQSSFGWNVNALVNLSAFDEAEIILQQKITEYTKAGLYDYLAFTCSKLAEVEEQKGNYSKALSFSMKSFDLYRQTGNDFNCKQLLNEMGQNIYFRHFNNYDSALYFFRKALTFKTTDKNTLPKEPAEELSIYNNIANVYVEKKMYDVAFVNFDLAFNKINKGLSEKNILQYENLNEFARLHKIDYLVHLLIDKGDAYKRRYESESKPALLASAKETYRVADKLMERVIKAQFAAESRLYWRKESRRLYENAIRACWLSNDPENAFYFFERSRAVLLAIQLAEQNWLDKDAISSLAVLRKKLVFLQGMRKGLPVNSVSYKQYSDSILMHSQALYYKQEGIRQQNKLYYQANDTVVASVADIRQSLLKDHQGLVEIFSGAGAVYVLLLTPGNIQMAIADKKAYQQASEKYISFIADRNAQNSNFKEFREVSTQLYALLFQGLRVPEGRIIVSPDGAYFPFESLIADNRAASPVYLLEKHMVSYTYSAQFLLNNFTSASTAGAGNFLGVAPMRYRSEPRLAELTGSDESLQNIGGLLSHPVYSIGQDASKNNFLSSYPNYKIIQLYTHASDSSNRSEPVIYFNDSALYLSELVPGAKPVTQLVVLSACETGNGTVYQGEGVFSFNRAFAAMGVASSISSLWSIDNLSTYRLTELFYKYLSAGLPLDIALQKAKLSFIKEASGESALPYYWAAPVLIGKTAPVVLSKPFAWPYLVAATMLAVLVIFGWKKLQHRIGSSKLRV